MSTTACPQCGTINPAGARFCRGCGLNLRQQPHQSGVLHPSPGAQPQQQQGVPPTPQTSGTIPTSGAPTVVQGAGQPGVPPQPVVAQALSGQIGNTPLAPGVTLQGGRYVIERALGKGGMGSVFLAQDTHVNNKPVVIKEMANVYATEEERREAEQEFQAEMATLAALSHPNIPQITDYFTESNRHFAVQEYVGGQDLQKAIEAAQAPGQPPQGLAEKQVLSWMSQVLSVLDYLEAQNPQVIHRDIKPGNILVDASNRVRVVDFGIASHKFKPGSTRAVGPQVSTALGTPGYAPQEQFTGQETVLSDLYALGATMHHLLTGRDPTKIQPLWQYPPVRTLNPKVSPATERIVARAVQNDEKKRYQSAADMKRDVDRVLNPPGALSTWRGRAIAVLVVLLLIAVAGAGSYIYAQLRGQPRPTGVLSDGSVAFDTDTTDLAALGVTGKDARAWIAHKVQASKDMASGDTNGAIAEYRAAVAINPADAESRIYIEDSDVLDHDPHPYRIAIGGSFAPAPNGSEDDVSVGRQDLQGAYTAQMAINNAGGINGHLLYLVLANDSSSAGGAQTAARQLSGRSDILAMVGFAFSARTKAAIPYVAERGIPEVSPSASNPGLTAMSSYFFRICPSDTQQGKIGLNYLLDTLLKGKPHPTIAVFGDPNDAYAGGLSALVRGEAARRGVTVVPETYVIGQSDFSNLAQDVKAHHVDAVYFAGYAREALLLSGAMDAAGIPRTIPIMSDDAFYEPAAYIANPTPKGRFHFTSFFFPDEYSLLNGADRARLVAMEQRYKGYFLKPGSPVGGYGTSRVSSDTALTYDAVETIAYAIAHLPANGVTRQGLQKVLSGLGSATPAYQGISGLIRYATPSHPFTVGDPIDKALVILYLDPALGRTHLAQFLGAYS